MSLLASFNSVSGEAKFAPLFATSDHVLHPNMLDAEPERVAGDAKSVAEKLEMSGHVRGVNRLRAALRSLDLVTIFEGKRFKQKEFVRRDSSLTLPLCQSTLLLSRPSRSPIASSPYSLVSPSSPPPRYALVSSPPPLLLEPKTYPQAARLPNLDSTLPL